MRFIVPLSLLVLSGAPAAAQQPCVADPAQVVDAVFGQVLDRPADPGSAEMTQALASGRATVRDIVAHVAGSPEYEARFFWPPLVAAAYRQVLQRGPTDGEMREAALGLAGGHLSPPEFIARLATRAANNDPNAIRMVYRRLLGRDPDPDGLAAYTSIAQRDGLGAVTESIVSSPEYRQRATATGMPLQSMDGYAESIRAMYRHVLGREADPGGMRALIELASVYGPREPVHRMLTSPEYQQRYGPNGIPGTNHVFCGPEAGERVAVPRWRRR